MPIKSDKPGNYYTEYALRIYRCSKKTCLKLWGQHCTLCNLVYLWCKMTIMSIRNVRGSIKGVREGLLKIKLRPLGIHLRYSSIVNE